MDGAGGSAGLLLATAAPHPLSAPLQVQGSENLSLSLARERAPRSVIIKLH